MILNSPTARLIGCESVIAANRFCWICFNECGPELVSGSNAVIPLLRSIDSTLYFCSINPRQQFLRQKRTLYGKTADERLCTTIENPVPVEDLNATIYHALAYRPLRAFVMEKRPVYVTKDGKGKPITSLFG